MQLLSTTQKNTVLQHMIDVLNSKRQEILFENKKDLDGYDPDDRAMFDRLVVNDKKVDGMIKAVKDIMDDTDPVGQIKYQWKHSNGMQVINKTAPFGTIMIIYESRPDVTIEAAVVAFKSNNKILLKGGKEAIHTNKVLVKCWHEALTIAQLSTDWISLLELKREETQQFLKNPPVKIDLIVPRGGEGLIQFVKQNATCPVLISGRGNNFLYVHDDADRDMAINLIVQSKIQKISACNALDKVLINENLENKTGFIKELIASLKEEKVEVILGQAIQKDLGYEGVPQVVNEGIWSEEFLAMKIVIDTTENLESAIDKINKHCGGHSASIVTNDKNTAEQFMDNIDAAAVYHNASTRFTDGGQFGIGAELAISTDKLHHRGPLGLHQLVTNKWYVFGSGQIRE